MNLKRSFGLLTAALALLVCLPGPAARAYDDAEMAAVKASVELFLQNYTAEAMLYEDRAQTAASVADPGAAPLVGDGQQVFRISKKDVTVAELQKNIAFVEKKALFYSKARQMQGIYRENLQASYKYPVFEIEGNVCHLSVTETLEFRYLDSTRTSVYETPYSMDLVRLGTSWLVADITDGSRFDGLYKKNPDFDPAAALAEFETQLHTPSCTVSSPYDPSAPAETGRIYYNGSNAAAYAYTYARQSAGLEREDFYNAQFPSYAGQGGDCMNFTSQCMWAGFGGSQTDTSVNENHLPMDADGDSQWYSYGPDGGEASLSWVSCQSFRKYLTGELDGSGTEGSNAAAETGMYATILDVGEGSPIAGISAESLVGAAAHVEGSGGTYAHAIVLTEAVGTARSEIWFCCHTKDLTHIKVGDYYFGPMKIYIPRYIRTDAFRPVTIQMDRLAPVPVSASARVGFHTEGAPANLTLTITAPGEEAGYSLSVPGTNQCGTDYRFDQAGLYRVDCRASVPGLETVQSTFYIRCFGEMTEPPVSVPETAPEPVPAPGPDAEPPDWLFA